MEWTRNVYSITSKDLVDLVAPGNPHPISMVAQRIVVVFKCRLWHLTIFLSQILVLLDLKNEAETLHYNTPIIIYFCFKFRTIENHRQVIQSHPKPLNLSSTLFPVFKRLVMLCFDTDKLVLLNIDCIYTLLKRKASKCTNEPLFK